MSIYDTENAIPAFGGLITLKELYPKWIKHKRLFRAPNTVNRNERDWKAYYLGTEIIDVPLKKMTKLMLEEWAYKLIRQHNLCSHQYQNIVTIINQILDYAVDLEILESNPYKSVSLKGKSLFRAVKKPDSRTQVFTKRERVLFRQEALKHFESGTLVVHKLAPLAALFLMYTMLRPGEVLALRYTDILAASNKVRVLKQYRYETDEIVEHTKGSVDERDFPLIKEAVELIDKARKTGITNLMDSGTNVNKIREWVGHQDERTT